MKNKEGADELENVVQSDFSVVWGTRPLQAGINNCKGGNNHTSLVVSRLWRVSQKTIPVAHNDCFC
ncbi:hypothetical protein [Desulforhopalus sp. 52FAK]